MQLASLQRSKIKKKKIICNLQETLQKKEDQIKALSLEIATKEGQENQRMHTEDTSELNLKEEMSKELTDMKMDIIRLQDEVSRLRTAVKLSREEVSCYQEHATSILTATSKIKVNARHPEIFARALA